ncbi:alpha/beta fold hydrolase [Glutamicibacter sp. NPDC127525]|uniref:alpha/beta fold hydrolase n=1 Tax=unclassified Glutamicibacter TaxID=2627139 RepID=UPI003636B7D7
MALPPAHALINVASKDGTMLSVTVTGEGPPMVIVPGSLGTARDWQAVADATAPYLTTYAIDRCGRAASGDHSEYSLQREVEDVSSVLDLAGPEAILFGHSFGGLVSLALSIDRAISGLALYEPGLPLNGPVAGAALAPFSTLVASGDMDAALRFGVENYVGLTADEATAFAQTPEWSKLMPLTPTWTRELAAIDSFTFDIQRLSTLATPALMMAGELSPAWLVDVTRQMHEALPQSTFAVLPGQGHGANASAPDLVAAELVRFASTLNACLT